MDINYYSKNPEDLFDMTYTINDNLKEIPNNYQGIIDGINFLSNKIKKEKNKIQKGKIYSKIGFYFKLINEFSKAEIELKKAIKIFNEEKDILNKFVAHIRLAQTFQFKGNLHESLRMINELENELNENIKLETYRDFVYQHKGKILFDLENYKEAQYYFNKALEIRGVKNNVELLDSTKLALNITQIRLENIFKYSEKITSWIEEILPPVKLLNECRLLLNENNELIRKVMGYSKLNNPIEVYEFGKGEKSILIYGFPDPGEAIGGTTILSLMKRLVLNDEKLNSFNLRWILIPCLNFDDQPNNGEKLSKIMKNKNQEVDWCLDNPREETKVLLEIAEKYKPIITIPLHDEFHCTERIPVYFPVSPKIDRNLSEKLRECIEHYGLEIDKSINHSEMGAGFFEMSEVAKDYNNSTFSILSNYGFVIECELSDLKELGRNELCEIQISLILEIIENILKNTINPVDNKQLK